MLSTCQSHMKVLYWLSGSRLRARQWKRGKHQVTAANNTSTPRLNIPAVHNSHQISLVMDKFESQFADLDVQTSYMESTMSDSTAQAMPQDQVDSLINRVADEAGLEVRQGLGEAQVPQSVPQQQEAVAVKGEEDGRLADRLRALRVSVGSDCVYVCASASVLAVRKLARRHLETPLRLNLGTASWLIHETL
jgi:hypothetical protein